MVSTNSRVDLAEESDSISLGDALGKGSRRGRVPEQLGSDDDVVCGSAGESLVLLVLQVGLIVDDKVEYRGSPIWIGDQYFLAQGWH